MRQGGKSDFSFSQVPRADIPRSTFLRNHCYKTTFDAGYLIPFYVDEALPGDTFNVKVSAFARMATPIVPIMDNLYLDMFFFAVPNRLVWSNWQRFCGEQDNPGDSTDYVVPQISNPGVTGFDEGSIYDYFGIPTQVEPTRTPSALFFRAYNLIWNEWFRDQNLQNSVVVNLDDGPDSVGDYELLKRGKRHDYFTSCLPWPQKGEAVSMFGNAIVKVRSAEGLTFPGDPIGTGEAQYVSGSDVRGLRMAAVSQAHWSSVPAGTGNVKWSDPQLAVDLSEGLSPETEGTINNLREAFQIQKLLERDARGGTRYVELLKSHFGVTSPDARLQRPEFLGGGSTPVSINPVSQTSETGAGTPQGNLAAYGVVGSHGNGFTKSFVEHTILIGLMMVRADLSYQLGLQKMFARQLRYDFYWPALAHLGEQVVWQYEINNQGAGGAVFGYQERWAEYRYHPSLITGKFRSNATGSLDFWHLGQALGAVVLNAAFIEENPPIDRVIAVDSEPHFLFDSYFQVKCARPMPLYSVPGLADHF